MKYLLALSLIFTPPFHYLNFTPQISVPDGYFRLLIPEGSGVPANPLPAATIADQPGYTFAPPVSFRAGDTGCTTPVGFHCYEFPYTGPGPAGTPLVITLELAAPLSTPFALRHYSQLGEMVAYTTADSSSTKGVTVTAIVPATPAPSPLAFPALPFLPATVTRLTTREGFAVMLPYLLATAILLLLIIVWRRRYNLLILDALTGKPIDHFMVYHSRPTGRRDRSPFLITRREPISYQGTPRHRGRLHIPHLTRYSTLTIRVGDTTTILSLSVPRRLYVILL